MGSPIINSYSVRSNWASDDSLFITEITAATVTINCTAQSGATISRVTASLNLITTTLTATGGGTYVGTLPTDEPGSVDIIVVVTDSNNESTTLRLPIVIKAHSEPILAISAFRCDANGDKDMGGGYLSITVWANSTPSAIGISQITANIEAEGSQVDSISLTNGVAYIWGSGAVDGDTEYTIYATAIDNSSDHIEDTVEADIPKVVRVINVKDEGTGIAFGKLCTEDEKLQSAWQIDCDKGIHAMKTLYCDYEATGVDRANAIALTTTSASNKFSRTSLIQFSVDSSTGAMLNKYEQYRFPEVTQNMAANAIYDLVTSKNTRIAYSSVTNGGTTQYTIANNSRHFVLVIGSGVTNNYAVFMFACTSTGTATQRQISKGSGITVTTSGTTISITSSGAAATVMDWAISGDNLEVTT